MLCNFVEIRRHARRYTQKMTRYVCLSVLFPGLVAIGVLTLDGCASATKSHGVTQSSADSGMPSKLDAAEQDTDTSVDGPGMSVAPARYVFVIALENHDEDQIIGDRIRAPYLNDVLVTEYASASNFIDPLPLDVQSEPHYVWMEAGTNEFPDHGFTTDDDPSATNSTSSTLHLASQIEAAGNGLSWRAYQEGLDTETGLCPIVSSGFYAPRHDPFVFFQDVSGNPPSTDNAFCIAHHKTFAALAADLANGEVASYNFITPNLCNDMHGAADCPGDSADVINAGDAWLKANVPPLLAFANANDGVIFIVFDEGDATLRLPFLAIGRGVKKHHVGAVKYTHGSLVKTVERIFGLPYLPTVASSNDLSDLFAPGALP
jgi:hypothetical protein